MILCGTGGNCRVVMVVKFDGCDKTENLSL